MKTMMRMILLLFLHVAIAGDVILNNLIVRENLMVSEIIVVFSLCVYLHQSGRISKKTIIKEYLKCCSCFVSLIPIFKILLRHQSQCRY